MPRLLVMTLCAVSLSVAACGEEEPTVARGAAGIVKKGAASAAKAGAATKTGAAKAGAAKGGAAKAGAKAGAKSGVKVPAFELAPTDLTIDDFNATIQAPKGAAASTDAGTAHIKLDDGKRFWVQVSLQAPDLKAVKAAAEKNTVQKLVRVHTEADDVLIYESTAFGRTSVWLDMAVRVGARRVHCASGRGQFNYDLGHIQAFKAACESLELKR